MTDIRLLSRVDTGDLFTKPLSIASPTETDFSFYLAEPLKWMEPFVHRIAQGINVPMNNLRWKIACLISQFGFLPNIRRRMDQRVVTYLEVICYLTKRKLDVAQTSEILNRVARTTYEYAVMSKFATNYVQTNCLIYFNDEELEKIYYYEYASIQDREQWTVEQLDEYGVLQSRLSKLFADLHDAVHALDPLIPDFTYSDGFASLVVDITEQVFRASVHPVPLLVDPVPLSVDPVPLLVDPLLLPLPLPTSSTI
jgi:hypothetical protein